MRKMGDKKAALELSIGTIVVIVLSVSMLILGIVLIRQIMCGALGLTSELNSKVKGEINQLFGSTGGEVQCIGAGDAVKFIPGQTNNIFCSVKAPARDEYTFTVIEISSDNSRLDDATITKWLRDAGFTGSQTIPISPGDDTAKKAIRMKIPEAAPEGTIFLTVETTKKDDTTFGVTQNLDLEVSRVGFVRNTIC